VNTKRRQKKKGCQHSFKTNLGGQVGPYGKQLQGQKAAPLPQAGARLSLGRPPLCCSGGRPGHQLENQLSRLGPPPHPATRAVPLASRSALSRATVMGAEITIFTDRTSSHRKCLSSAHGPKTSWKTKENECCRYIPGTWRTRGSQASKVWSTRYVSRAKGSGQRASPAVVP